MSFVQLLYALPTVHKNFKFHVEIYVHVVNFMEWLKSPIVAGKERVAVHKDLVDWYLYSSHTYIHTYILQLIVQGTLRVCVQSHNLFSPPNTYRCRCTYVITYLFLLHTDAFFLAENDLWSANNYYCNETKVHCTLHVDWCM